MSRPTPSWRGVCLLIAGTLVFNGCGGDVASSAKRQSQSLTEGPDLVITDVKGPANARTGDPFFVSARVCNRGTESAYPGGSGVALQILLSTTPTQQLPPGAPPSSQQVVGEVDMGPALEPGECITRTVTAYAVRPPAATGDGAFYLGALIDTRESVEEVDELNNGFVLGLMGVGELGDFVVTELKAPSSARSGESLPVELRVCNAGSSYLGGTRVGLFVSTQATLSPTAPGSPPSPTQLQVGEVSVPWMEPGLCLTLQGDASAQLPAAATPGQPLYLGALVDPTGSQEELREDNNARIAGRLSIGTRPDLVVSDVTGVDTLFPYGWMNASVRVCNVGTEWSSTVAVDLLLSTLPAIQDASTPGSMTESVIGGAQTWGLDAGQCSTLMVQGSVSVPPASPPNTPLYVGARVDGTLNVPELREDNNTFVKGLVGVGSGPDLVIRSLTAPDSVGPSYGAFTAEAKVCNVGTEPAYSSRLELYLSTEDAVVLPPPNGPIYSRTQVPVGSTDVGFLSPGDCAIRRVEGVVQLPPEAMVGGNWRTDLTLGAVVDSQRTQMELREDNNVFTHGKLGAGYGADLVLRDLKVPANLREGQSFTATYTVCNAGSGNVSGVDVSLYLSTNATPPEPLPQFPSFPGPLPGYFFLGSSNANLHLNEGECIAQRATFQAYAPSLPPEQPVYLSGVVDTSNSEQRRDNNGFAAGRVGLGSMKADLAVTRITAPDSARDGGPFTTSVRVCNLGTEMSSSTTVEVYLSSEPSLVQPSPYGPSGPPSTQALVNGVSVPSLGVGACITREVTGSAWRPPGSSYQQPLYVGALVNPGTWSAQQELRRDNNVLMAGRISLGSGPDLIVTAMEAPPTFEPGFPFFVSARVCNVGNEPSSSTSVALILSQDDRWSPPPAGGPPPPSYGSQEQFGTLPVPQLEPGQCATPSDTVSAYGWGGWLEHPVFVGATVDRSQSLMELREDNNVFVLGRIAGGSGPDLVVTDVTGPASAQPWQTFTATVTVCNQGTQDAFHESRVELYVLSVPQLSMPAESGPSYPQPSAWTSVDPLEAGACVSIPVEGNLYVSGMSEAQTFQWGAAVDTFRYIQELREDNNTFVGARIGVGNRPDLVITAMGGPASVTSSGTLRAPLTVCNQGTSASQYQQLEVVLSTEPVLAEPVLPPEGMEFFPTRSRLGMLSVPSLQPETCVTLDEPFSVSLPPAAVPESPLFLGALLPVSSEGQELRTDNNTFVRGRIGVGNAPDLVITQVTAPFSVRNGNMFTTTVKVCNQGTATAGANAGRLELFLSTTSALAFPQDVAMGSQQVSLGFVNLGALQPQQCTTRQLNTQAITPPGSTGSGLFYLGAIVDAQRSVMELREDNNTFAQGFLAVLP